MPAGRPGARHPSTGRYADGTLGAVTGREDIFSCHADGSTAKGLAASGAGGQAYALWPAGARAVLRRTPPDPTRGRSIASLTAQEEGLVADAVLQQALLDKQPIVATDYGRKWLRLLRIVQVVETDLDGDGVDERFCAAQGCGPSGNWWRTCGSPYDY